MAHAKIVLRRSKKTQTRSARMAKAAERLATLPRRCEHASHLDDGLTASAWLPIADGAAAAVTLLLLGDDYQCN